MKAGEVGRDFRFLALSVEDRNKAIALLADVKLELSKDHLLREIGLDAPRWEDICLVVFLSRPKEHYLRIVRGDPRARYVSTKHLMEEIEAIYALFKKKSHGGVER